MKTEYILFESSVYSRVYLIQDLVQDRIDEKCQKKCQNITFAAFFFISQQKSKNVEAV